MIPRFSNPHFLPKSFEIVPRAELYHDDKGASHACDEVAISELNQLLSQNIGLIRHSTISPKELGDDVSPGKSNKRRKKEHVKEEENTAKELEDRPLFRLVSSVLPPLPVSLLPPPPPPPITREPDAEDNELQAAIRQERSQIASVDAATILRQSKIESSILLGTNTKSKVINLHTELANPSPHVMIIRTTQLPRKTRPSVKSHSPTQYPYVPDISTLSIEPAKSRTMDCPTVDAQIIQPDPSRNRKRSRRRKTINLDKRHPPPQFWRPSPSLEGKCRGYAYGYPSYLAAATGILSKKYSRDRMKTGVHVDGI